VREQLDQGCYQAVSQLGVEPATSGLQARHVIVALPSHTSDQENLVKHIKSANTLSSSSVKRFAKHRRTQTTDRRTRTTRLLSVNTKHTQRQTDRHEVLLYT